MQKSNKRTVQPDKDRLNKDEEPIPLEVVSDFCDTYHLDEAKDVLWEWVTNALSKSPSIYDTGRERSNLLFFYEKMKALLKAVYTIDEQQKEKEKPGRNKQPGVKDK